MTVSFHKALLFYARNERIMSCVSGQRYWQDNIGKVTLDEIEGEWELMEEEHGAITF